MYKEFEHLEPAGVWKYFGEILQIPRPSKQEGKISTYLQQFGKEHGLDTLHDELGNVLIRKPATPGYEQAPCVCLQSHMDMVCEKNATKQHDFLHDPITARCENGWVVADGTTLGADDGIGVAAALAILADNSLEHGPLEALFTVDEETGLTGANGLSDQWLKSEILLNFDDEDEGEFCIGCAGGIDTVADMPYNLEPAPQGCKAFTVEVKGLKGGHSGDDINRGRGCANKLLNRILWNGTYRLGMRLATVDGGNLRNAIAREACTTVLVPESNAQAFQDMVANYHEKLRFEFRSTEPDLCVNLYPAEMPQQVVDLNSQTRLVNVLYAVAHGVLAMSREVPDFVETSTNLASIKMVDGNFHICTSQRSSVESAKQAAAEKIEATFLLAGATVKHSDGYPGWTPNPQSRVLQVGVETYRSLYGKEPTVRAIHAGLECGLIGEKYPKMDMISYGPTLRGVHSPDEKLEIKTVKMFWDLTLAILKNLK